MPKKKSAKVRLGNLQEALQAIAAYPPKDSPRRADDGYPLEFTYDKFAYRRLVDSYREAITKVLKKSRQ